jgi:hypothetical protein
LREYQRARNKAKQKLKHQFELKFDLEEYHRKLDDVAERSGLTPDDIDHPYPPWWSEEDIAAYVDLTTDEVSKKHTS